MKIYSFRKKSFLLAEILLTLFLIAVCALPLVKGPIIIFRKELQSIEQIERQRLANLAFFNIKKKLYKKEIPWKELEKEGGKIRRYLYDEDLSIAHLKKKKIKIHYRIYPILPKIEPEKSSHRLLEIPIYFDKAKQTDIKYQVYAKKE